MTTTSPPLVVVMGVSGSGKTTVGAALAQRLRVPFADADDFHPPENVTKMAAGVPLTDEIHLTQASALMGGIALERATDGPAVAERTAAIVWQVLNRIGKPVMLWNVFPFHPHDAGDPMSNRCHTRAEREATWPLLQSLMAMIQPKRIVAIGRDAHMALEGLDIPITAIRHPSYGGQREFIDGMFDLYGIAEEPIASPELPLGATYAASAKEFA